MTIEMTVLTKTTTIPCWVASALKYLEDNSDCTVSLVVVGSYDSEFSGETNKSSLIDWQSKSDQFPNYNELNADIPVLTVSNEILHCDPVNITGNQISLQKTVVNDIKNQSDIVFHFGLGILNGEILTQPKYGVVGYHFGDIRKYRGGPPGFWEYINMEDKCDIIVQKYTEELDAGHIICKKPVHIGSLPSLSAVRAKLQYEAIPLLCSAINHIENPDHNPETVNEQDLGPIYSKSDQNLYIMAKFILVSFYKNFIANRDR